MKKIYILLIGLIILSGPSFAQKNTNLGIGYFGQNITHPGFVLEFEHEQFFSEKVSLPVRVNLGFYNHPRNHQGFFCDVNYGFRQHFNSGLFLEESIGFGILQSRLNSDGVYEVDENGSLADASRYYSPDFMPSLTLGIGYKLSNDQGSGNTIWMRPKLFWQLPHKTSALYNAAIQVGFTHTFKTK